MAVPAAVTITGVESEATTSVGGSGEGSGPPPPQAISTNVKRARISNCNELDILGPLQLEDEQLLKPLCPFGQQGAWDTHPPVEPKNSKCHGDQSDFSGSNSSTSGRLSNAA